MGFLVGSCDPKFKDAPRDQWCVDFLPYTRGLDGRPIEAVIGYANPNRGHGYGTWAEFYATETEARERFAFLKACGSVERGDLLQGPRGALIDRFSDEY
jgi:hypothetical protein